MNHFTVSYLECLHPPHPHGGPNAASMQPQCSLDTANGCSESSTNQMFIIYNFRKVEFPMPSHITQIACGEYHCVALSKGNVQYTFFLIFHVFFSYEQKNVANDI